MKKKEKISGASSKDLWIRCFSKITFLQPSSFFRRHLLKEQGFLNENLNFVMDYDLLVKTILNYEIVATNEIISKYRLRRFSNTSPSRLHLEWSGLMYSRIFCAL